MKGERFTASGTIKRRRQVEWCRWKNDKWEGEGFKVLEIMRTAVALTSVLLKQVVCHKYVAFINI